MSPKQSTAVQVKDDGNKPTREDGPDYWNSMIDEKVAAEFLGLEPRTLQSFRQRGNGPLYIKISSRCLRYRRLDLKTWSDGMVRRSTSDPGRAA